MGKRLRLRITGVSMTPTLRPGDLVLVDFAAYHTCPPQSNQIVVAWHPFQRDLQIIKRISQLTAEGQVILLSDNPSAGSDSRQWGPLDPSGLIGRVTSCSPRQN